MGAQKLTGSFLGPAGLKRCGRAGLSTLSWHLLTPACFLFIKDKLWYQNLPKIPFSSHPVQGPGGYWAEPCVELGNSSGQRFPTPCRPSSSQLRTSHYSAQGPETSGVILEVQPHHHGLHGDCLSPRLHTNCHGHSVAQPTASAVGRMKVRAIVSPTQAWGCVT